MIHTFPCFMDPVQYGNRHRTTILNEIRRPVVLLKANRDALKVLAPLALIVVNLHIDAGVEGNYSAGNGQ